MIRTGIIYLLTDLCMDIFFTGISSAFVALPDKLTREDSADGLVPGNMYGFYCLVSGEVKFIEGIYRHELNGDIFIEVNVESIALYRLLGLKSIMESCAWKNVVGYITY